MKRLITLALSLLTLPLVAQFTSSFHYALGLPQQQMAKNIKAIHQGALSVGYRLPNAFQFVRVGADIGYGGYANLTVPTEFSLPNTRPTTLNVLYSSNSFVANGFLQFDLMRKGNVIPYAMVKGGIQNLHSSIFIEDPTDPDGCRALENESILSDDTKIFSYGGGLRYELAKPNFWRASKQFIDVQFLATRGGNIDYINTKRLTDHANHHTTVTTGDDGAKPLEMRFINVVSQVVHSHKVAEVYTTPLRLLEIRVGYYLEF
jgi:hypothetical protein